MEKCQKFEDLHVTDLFICSSCREKKDSEVQTLEVAKDNEVDVIDTLEKENDELRDKLNKLKSHYFKLCDFAKKNSIELKPRNVPMGSLDSTWGFQFFIFWWVNKVTKKPIFVQIIHLSWHLAAAWI